MKSHSHGKGQSFFLIQGNALVLRWVLQSIYSNRGGKMKSVFKTLTIGWLLTLAWVGTAQADDYHCSSTISKRHIKGDVIVRNGSCTLTNMKVDGNVKVYAGGSVAVKQAEIDGDIQAENARAVTVQSSSIDGNIQIKQSGAVQIAKAEVDGDIQLMNNHGAARVERNQIKGNLQCKSNRSAPTGSSNHVKGNKEDQCRGL